MSVGGDRSELERTLVDKVPARVVAASTGAIIGGPLGALVSAAAAPVIEYVLSTGNQRLVGNASRVVDSAAEIDGRTPSEMLRYAQADDERLALLLAAVLAAMETLSEPRLRTLAYVLADGFSDDARLDVSRMYVRALRSLETYHVRVLDHLDRVFRDGTDELSTSCNPDELAPVFPGLGPALHPILAVLDREGLVASGPINLGDGTMTIGHIRITPFGRDLLDWIARGGSNDSPS